MTGTQRLEHAVLAVPDVERAVAFYTDVMGLARVEGPNDRSDRSDRSITWLGCGLDERADLGLVAGGTGLEHAAIRVDDADALAARRGALAEAGIETTETLADDPAYEGGVRFALPGGVELEFLSVADKAYRRVTDPAAPRGGVAPLDMDHVTLMTDAIEADLDVLKAIGFRVSEVHLLDETTTRFAWTRYGTQHHDVALVNTDDPDYTLHHLAFAFASVDHMKSLLDRFAGADHELEVGVNRHAVGSNVFAYFQAPDGNRIELSTEMATLDDSTPTRVNDPEVNTLTAWGGVSAPETFKDGT
jgi:catechol 2,3-dioxygenase